MRVFNAQGKCSSLCVPFFKVFARSSGLQTKMKKEEGGEGEGEDKKKRKNKNKNKPI